MSFGLVSANVELREPCMLPQGSQASFQVERGTSRFPLSRCMGIGPHLEFRRVTQGSLPVATGILGFLSSFSWGVRPLLTFRHGILLSSRVVKGLSGLLLSQAGNLGFF